MTREMTTAYLCSPALRLMTEVLGDDPPPLNLVQRRRHGRCLIIGFAHCNFLTRLKARRTSLTKMVKCGMIVGRSYLGSLNPSMLRFDFLYDSLLMIESCSMT